MEAFYFRLQFFAAIKLFCLDTSYGMIADAEYALVPDAASYLSGLPNLVYCSDLPTRCSGSEAVKVLFMTTSEFSSLCVNKHKKPVKALTLPPLSWSSI